jgi:hypothetical protein
MEDFLYEDVLDRWYLGHSGDRIKRDLDLSRHRVSRIIVSARLRGDRRAIHHKWPSGEIKGKIRQLLSR